MNAKTLRVLIIGCGNIAGAFDQDRQQGDFPLTHAGAFSRDNRFSLAACVDPDENRREKFMETWSVPEGFRSVEEVVVSGENYDVISICSPTTNHAYDLEASIRLQPKLIFCEKPVTTSLFETERLVAECEKANIPLAVNYTRRWDPDITELQKDIQTGQRGQLRSVIGTYNKGILNNGSHMLDLLNLLVGPVNIFQVGKPMQDYLSNDPCIPAWLEDRNGMPIQLSCGHAKDYSFFELQLVFSSGVLAMEEGGMIWRERHVIDSDLFKGYRKLDDGVIRVGKYPRAMLQAVDNIYRTIEESAPLASTGETAITAHHLCEKIKQLAVN